MVTNGKGALLESLGRDPQKLTSLHAESAKTVASVLQRRREVTFRMRRKQLLDDNVWRYLRAPDAIFGYRDGSYRRVGPKGQLHGTVEADREVDVAGIAV